MNVRMLNSLPCHAMPCDCGWESVSLFINISFLFTNTEMVWNENKVFDGFDGFDGFAGMPCIHTHAHTRHAYSLSHSFACSFKQINRNTHLTNKCFATFTTCVDQLFKSLILNFIDHIQHLSIIKHTHKKRTNQPTTTTTKQKSILFIYWFIQSIDTYVCVINDWMESGKPRQKKNSVLTSRV